MSAADPSATGSLVAGASEATSRETERHGIDARTREAAEITELAVGDVVTVPVVEETARVGTRAVETGRVRVRTATETVEEVLRESLRSETVAVTRVPIDRTLAAGEVPPGIRTEGEVTIIPVLEEILVVEKRLVLREEVHLRRSASADEVEVPVTLRRQRAVIERVSPEGHVDVYPEPTPEPTPKETKP